MAFRFEQLKIWHEANQFGHEIYKLTRKFPKTELFSLSDQLKRAANSIAANIAEGSGSHSKKDFIHFLDISIKSTYETVALIFRAEQEGYLDDQKRESVYKQAEVLIKRIQAFKKAISHMP